mgnify:CR=1 FL=1
MEGPVWSRKRLLDSLGATIYAIDERCDIDRESGNTIVPARLMDDIYTALQAAKTFIQPEEK